MRVTITLVHFQFRVKSAPKPVVRNHSLNSVLDQQLRRSLAAATRTFRFMPADKAGKTSEFFLNLFLPSQPDFLSVDYDDKIACIYMRSEDRLSFTAKKIRYGYRNAAKRAILGVYYIPLALDLTRFG